MFADMLVYAPNSAKRTPDNEAAAALARKSHLTLNPLSDDDKAVDVAEVPQGGDLEPDERDLVLRALEFLSPKHAKVIQYRFFDGLTLSQSAANMGVTKERIRQIELEALARLRVVMNRLLGKPTSTNCPSCHNNCGTLIGHLGICRTCYNRIKQRRREKA